MVWNSIWNGESYENAHGTRIDLWDGDELVVRQNSIEHNLPWERTIWQVRVNDVVSFRWGYALCVLKEWKIPVAFSDYFIDFSIRHENIMLPSAV